MADHKLANPLNGIETFSSQESTLTATEKITLDHPDTDWHSLYCLEAMAS